MAMLNIHNKYRIKINSILPQLTNVPGGGWTGDESTRQAKGYAATIMHIVKR